MQARIPQLPAVKVAAEVREIRSDTLHADYFAAGTEAPGPAILMLGGSEGGLADYIRDQALALQAEGFTVLQMSYYRAPGQAENLELVPLESFDLALAWLSEQDNVDAGRMAVFGTSKGAEAALIVASRHPELKAVVASAPSSVAWQGINWARDGRVPEASWSLDGAPYPALPYGAWDNSLGLYSLYANGLKAAGMYPDTAIRIENTAAATLLLCGEADTFWPSCEMSRQVKARAEDRGQPEVMLLAYSEAGHFVSGIPGPDIDPADGTPDSMGGTAGTNHASQGDSWPKIVAFLRENL